ncbi:MAG: inositol-3-phosphate synthase [Candidatus Omnitrophica bacterium]|nr:inositol-3-phosphate synthase [Candidatus Omnitrophota bacterium]
MNNNISNGNGSHHPSIKTAIIGVGNCASSLIQGRYFYADPASEVPGLITQIFGGYRVCDIEYTAAFDIDARKVGTDLSRAIFSEPNCTTVFQKKIPDMNCPVQMGYVIDSIADQNSKFDLKHRFEPLPNADADETSAKKRIVAYLKEKKVEVVVNYLPVGSEKNVLFYAECALEAGCAFVNAVPVFASKIMGNAFKNAGLPILGDDIKSQVGATIVHRVLTKLFEDRGQPIKKTYQLNVGGNTDFMNMLDRNRLESKKISKTNAVTSQMHQHKPDAANVYVGPSDYVSWLNDNKLCFIRIEAEQFGGVPMNLELRLSVEDSPNSAGVISDAIRAAKVALDRGLSGPILEASAYLFKSPVQQYDDETARKMLVDFSGNIKTSDSKSEKIIAAS